MAQAAPGQGHPGGADLQLLRWAHGGSSLVARGGEVGLLLKNVAVRCAGIW